jgi:hypothetical protein
VTLGYLYLSKKQWHQVRFVNRQLRKLPLTRAYISCLEAEIFKHSGDPKGANPWLRRAIEAAPDMLLPRVLILEVAIATHASSDECRQAAKEVFRLSPGNLFAERVLSELGPVAAPIPTLEVALAQADVGVS